MKTYLTKKILIILILLFIIISINIFYYSSNIELFDTIQPTEPAAPAAPAKPLQVIPLNIFQTWETHKLPPKMTECVEKLKSANPEFSYHLYDDKECREFIKNNFENDVLYAYDTLIPGAYKADLWRYCILYKYGGIYLDIKYYPVNGYKFITLTDKEYFVKDIEASGSGIYNALIICKPDNEILLKCINQIVVNVRERFYGVSSLSITGPLLMKQFITLNEPDLELVKTNKLIINLHKKPILQIYDEYFDEQKTFIKIPHYGELWGNRLVYTNG